MISRNFIVVTKSVGGLMEKQKIRIFLLVILLIISGASVYLFKLSKDPKYQFGMKYSISPNHPFEEIDDKKALSMLKNGTGALFIGYPECEWCQYYVKNLNKLAKAEKNEVIYYWNIKTAREKENEYYKEAVKLLDKYINYDDLGNKRIYVPALIGLKSSEIFFFDDETSLDLKGAKTPEEYWTNDRLKIHEEKIIKFLNELKSFECSSCNV